ncbi:MAG: rhamnulokinase [Lachnospiraceae bacterium]|nr:rhamnulokinase [Lachnospiraceae bacterium]
MSTYLAIDIGASSGRHILGSLVDGKITLSEIHRFKNGFTKKNGFLCWDIETLFAEVLTGIAKCKEIGKIPVSLGINTWGVDFVLVDKNGQLLGDAVSYRDSRTDGMDEILSGIISEQDLYHRTGIQKMIFNTVYQFMALQKYQPELLEAAAGFLMIPSYLSYLLTGERQHEYTISSTTALVNSKSKAWDFELIKKIGLPEKFFGEIKPPGTNVGNFLPEIKQRLGFGAEVILPCTHDTACAVVSAPIDEKSIFLSSGTWSIIGVELTEPICTEASRQSNLANEGGYQYRFRYLKNIMGLWIIQSIKKDYNDEYSFSDLADYAAKSSDFPSVFDVNEHRFLAPENMEAEIKAALKESGQQVPDNIGELIFCVYHSLAVSYAKTVVEIETITGKIYDKICIVGGGSQDGYLNELTAKICKKKVTAGPVEGTALGNILVQMISAGTVAGLLEARELVKKSFVINEYV